VTNTVESRLGPKPESCVIRFILIDFRCGVFSYVSPGNWFHDPELDIKTSCSVAFNLSAC
jgi:hypothetical protein